MVYPLQQITTYFVPKVIQLLVKVLQTNQTKNDKPTNRGKLIMLTNFQYHLFSVS